MACGTPVVAPRRGSYTELLERTGGGVLVEAEKVDALIQAVEQLLGDRNRRSELSRRATAGIAEHYSADEMVARALAVYERLMR